MKQLKVNLGTIAANADQIFTDSVGQMELHAQSVALLSFFAEHNMSNG